MAAKLCSSCGKPVIEGAKFCTECGATLVVSSTEQDHKKSQSEKSDAPRGYCDICGVKLTLLNMTTRQLYNEEYHRCSRCAKREHKRVRTQQQAAVRTQQQAAQQPATDFTQQQATKSTASPDYCVVCGVKLTLGNRNWRYRDKCGPCGVRFRAMEPEKARAALAQQQPKKQVEEQVKYLEYLGGFAGVTKKQTVDMRFEATQVIVERTPLLGKGPLLWVMPYDKIKGVRIDTAKNLTAARLLLTGILAFGLQKKHHYLVVSFEDAHGLMQNPVFEGNRINAAQKAIYQRIEAARTQPQAPQAAPIDVTEQIKKLGELHDQGLLTEQEFDSKKQELLARM